MVKMAADAAAAKRRAELFATAESMTVAFVNTERMEAEAVADAEAESTVILVETSVALTDSVIDEAFIEVRRVNQQGLTTSSTRFRTPVSWVKLHPMTQRVKTATRSPRQSPYLLPPFRDVV